MKTIIGDASDKTTVKQFLQASNFGSTYVKALKYAENGIMLNGTRVTVRACLHKGDVLELNYPEEKGKVLSENLFLEAVFLDEFTLVVNKPCGLPIHPDRAHFCGTAANHISYLLSGKEGVKNIVRIITRLDKETGGLVLAAKDAVTAKALCQDVGSGRIKKTYFAVCRGEDFPEVIDAPLYRDEKKGLTYVSPQGVRALTRLEKITSFKGLSLVKLMPETGRTHQLRAHLAFLNYPILGDVKYGGESASRLMLQMQKLQFVSGGKQVTAECELPEVFWSYFPNFRSKDL